ncbi:MAG: hypothetical protein RIC93_13620 [Alphaproteobacteria bacterium]
MGQKLPEGFEDLEHFVPEWVLPTERERNHYRVHQDQAKLREFYDIMMPRMAEIAAYLDDFPLMEMPRLQANLLELALMQMEVAPAIDFYDQPDVPNSVEFEKFEVLPVKRRYAVVAQ